MQVPRAFPGPACDIWKCRVPAHEGAIEIIGTSVILKTLINYCIPIEIIGVDLYGLLFQNAP